MIKNEEHDFPLVLLCTEKTVGNVVKYAGLLLEYLLPKCIVVIGKREIASIVQSMNYIEFVDEDTILDGLTYQNVKKCIHNQMTDGTADHRTGWYFQQFLKMAYAYVCESENYLVWDSDTIPTHAIDMFSQNGKKFFDVKDEYSPSYFSTMKRLCDGLIKKNSYSYISEHMLFDVKIMKRLICEIENNAEIKGDCFWEKVLNSIEITDLSKSGFSEFETYGTYVESYYPDVYEIRKWKSLREGTIFWGKNYCRESENRIEEYYDAISFEDHEWHNKLHKLFGYKIFQRIGFILFFENAKCFAKKILSGKRKK